MQIALSTAVPGTVPEVAGRVRAALAEQGFGVLTEIDMSATLKNKIDVDMEDYLILGACNPPMAHRAVSAEKQIGLLLPCNVVVRQDPAEAGRVLVEAMNPQIMVTVVDDNPALAEVADEVTTRLQAVIDAL
ncbi:DUF302 domain-containing protein [Gordonia sp. PP30]|uniref:DUF302 domain-containing protein n=1 Tax=unclassified Gordonia (in: high G+C Gram-positive bacteria) TaxID=2657482 RepID=UPI001FFE8EE3|nr:MULTISPECIES: DUF302 domain-containing protein [unclassified Gordonia (in: high G+C Gram-positive bacteria)]UQE74670.1 DUF302 domain-containing protein [Gordonia sp. PP30]